jgi:general secretion pathway protein D
MVVDADGELEARVIPSEPRSQQKNASEASHSATVSLGEGETVVLGGIITTEKTARTHKIPLMGDLPILGFAFRYHNSSVRREEFIVFLTPHFLQEEVKAEEKPEAGSASGQEGEH